MICPKCNNEIPEGLLYCDKCGEEIQIVPVFEAEIETDIEKHLAGISFGETKDMSDEIGEVKAGAKKILTKDLLTKDSGNLPEGIDSTEPGSVHKKWVHLAIRVGAVLSLLALIIIVYLLAISNSWTHQLSKADRLFDAGDYREAAVCYEKSIFLKNDEVQPYIGLANAYTALGDTSMAVTTYKRYLILDNENEEIFAHAVDLLVNESQYQAVNELLLEYADDVVRNEYNEYLSLPPTFNYDSGKYDKMVELEIKDTGVGKIYYTLDGTLPVESSEEYKSPIVLKKGEYEVRAVFVNEFGVFSEDVNVKLTIEDDSPEAPMISLESGSYYEPQQLRVIIPNECTVYYTVDGSEPDERSNIYGEPIDIQEGRSDYRFVAIDENGNSSEIIDRTYDIRLNVAISTEDGCNILINKLISIEYILDETGTLKNYPGKYIYLYMDVRGINGIPLYCYNEYYQTTSISKDMTGNIFGVDYRNGDVYKIVKAADGSYTLTLM
ncbi:MAG: chitobiase/beta-hexosaminidase C-terminal domain-containing protein [Lachnospiraceae bacterium]|nr:chitobiase/beta-hexosaminidase C-terminal domain-containing protein [Lachnospiraceae bacterium]